MGARHLQHNDFSYLEQTRQVSQNAFPEGSYRESHRGQVELYLECLKECEIFEHSLLGLCKDFRGEIVG